MNSWEQGPNLISIPHAWLVDNIHRRENEGLNEHMRMKILQMAEPVCGIMLLQKGPYYH